MPASNDYYFFDGNGFILKTNPARTFFLGVFEALGAQSPAVARPGGSSGVWFFRGLRDDLELDTELMED
jgi:hypothetical protein